MIRLRMIDQVGSGIRRMFETQRERNFPLPDYEIQRGNGDLPRVEVRITGRILDPPQNLDLRMRKRIPPCGAEGRYSCPPCQWVEKKERFVRQAFRFSLARGRDSHAP